MNKLTFIAVTCTAITSFAALAAQAEPVINSRGNAWQTAPGGLAGRSAVTAQGSNGALAGWRGITGDGQGNVVGSNAGGFTTESGGQGLRTRNFNRSSNGSLNASGLASASGANGSADRSGSFTRNADGSASGERSTTLTNANTGVTLDGSTTYTKGSGVSRTASCKDAAGNTVSCGSR
jgi:hypothetical protein